MSASSLHRESTDSLIYTVVVLFMSKEQAVFHFVFIGLLKPLKISGEVLLKIYSFTNQVVGITYREQTDDLWFACIHLAWTSLLTT